MRSAIPVIDIHPFLFGAAEDQRRVARAVDDACRSVGFLLVVGHGVPAELIDRAHAAARAFFDLDLEHKARYEPPPGGFIGYRGLASESLSYSRELDLSPPDLKEAWTVTREPRGDEPYFTSPQGRMYFPDNKWPLEVPELRAAWLALYQAMDGVAAQLMRIFALALDLPPAFFDDKIDKNISCLRALNYPEQPEAPLPGQLRAGAHTDYGSITLLTMDGAPGGLEVFINGTWHPVSAPPGALVTNIGDLMAQWTNDMWLSTLHRVVNPPPAATGSTRRQSLVFFHQPNYDAEVTPLPKYSGPERPPRYPTTTSGEHLFKKMTRAKNLNI